MSKHNDGGPAFPPVHDPATHPSGMTLRDYFAAAAMQGLLARGSLYAPGIAQDAYELAGKMIEERTKC
jgi:hypothetical protein